MESEPQVRTSRRAFIACCGGAALAVGGTLAAGPANAAPMITDSATKRDPLQPAQISGLENFHYATFTALLNSRFRMQHEGGNATLTLVAVKESKHNDPARGIEQFSLTFRGPGRLSLPQDCYQFSHRQLGDFMLFVVPSGDDKQGHYYQAVFSRIPRAAR